MRVVILGNSGSGKSTLAQQLAERELLAHLDLDTLAWEATEVPTRRPLAVSKVTIDGFLASNTRWVIEGCYADLLQLVTPIAERMLFLDPGVERCIDHARRRPWEPHKYPSPEAQDANLPMLLDWIAGYDTREDVLSRRAHEALFEAFAADKQRLTEPADYRGG
jgi:adenylate kinase family enzyme